MKAVYLDTHVVIWLYSGATENLPDVSKALIESCELLICPMVILEVQYLKEIGRINCSSYEVIEELRAKVELQVDDLPFEIITRKAIEITWTRDPFDRLIAASSLARSYPLITKDTNLLEQFPLAIWDIQKPLVQHLEMNTE